jgi:hypothetical protein
LYCRNTGCRGFISIPTQLRLVPYPPVPHCGVDPAASGSQGLAKFSTNCHSVAQGFQLEPSMWPAPSVSVSLGSRSADEAGIRRSTGHRWLSAMLAQTRSGPDSASAASPAWVGHGNRRLGRHHGLGVPWNREASVWLLRTMPTSAARSRSWWPLSDLRSLPSRRGQMEAFGQFSDTYDEILAIGNAREDFANAARSSLVAVPK